MFDVNESLKNWLHKLDNFKLIEYSKLPDIELYMDQIITIIDRQLSLFSYSSLDKMITSSMVNNYVKGNVIPSPLAKKYNREHLALLEEVITLKQILSIAEIKQIIDTNYKDSNKSDVFDEFVVKYKEANQKASNVCKDKLASISNNDVKGLNHLALELSLISNAYITIAKRILYYTNHYEAMLEQEQEEKEKKNKTHKKKDIDSNYNEADE